MGDETPMSWTEERVALLEKLWAEGLSASQIAGQLGGITRNAVIGKIHRLGLSGRAKAPSASRPRKPRPASKPSTGRTTHTGSGGGGGGGASVARQTRVVGNTALKVVAEQVIEAEVVPAAAAEVVPFGERKTLMELNEHTCRWPMGDPGSSDFAFCGRDSTPGQPYCAAHSRVAYQPAPDRRKKSSS
ncbi:GcrA family cell cycle regulator [Amorphus coralli]|uniref:GcrA family cell cycle regulator n=1 Tax=Amorphus coralli TaxID=340680 RepID=UPI00036A7CA5|nr:GcrA family cell cycle regulator [Amorphus coralli]